MKPSTIGGALIIGSFSLLPLGLLPILLGGLEGSGRLSKAGIGQAAMLELFGLALGATAGGYWMGRGAMRLKATLVALGLAAINVATAYGTTTTIVLLDRAVAGLLAGLLFGAANAVIVRAKNPDRLTGILSGSSMAPAIALAYAVPVLLIPTFGVGSGFHAIAIATLVAALASVMLVDELPRLEPRERITGQLSWSLALFGGAIILQGCGLGAAWTYIERLADQHGFGPSVVGLAVAGGLATQVVAVWLSAWIVPKVAKWPALLLLIAAQTGFIALAILSASPAVFIVSVCVFGSAAAAMQAFQVAQIIVIDTTRRTAVLVSPLVLFGNGLGPLIASFATTEATVHGGTWAAVAMSAGSALLCMVLAVTSVLIRAPNPQASKSTAME